VIKSAVALAIAVASALAAATAAAEPAAPRIVDLPETPAELRLDAAWQDAPLPAGVPDAPVGVWRHPSGAVLVVTRVAAPNGDAWRDATRAAYADDVEAGVRSAVPGYRRRSRAVRDLRGVPALDLSFRRTVDGTVEVVAMRVVFFRNYSVTATVAVPDAQWNRARRATEAAIAAFAPAPDYRP
jgi:hypothetical protein